MNQNPLTQTFGHIMKYIKQLLYVAIAIPLCSCQTQIPLPMSDSVILESEIDYRDGCPPTLSNCTQVALVKHACLCFDEYTFPKPHDPDGTATGINNVFADFVIPDRTIELPFTLGEALKKESFEPSNVVLLEPFKVIAIDSAGKKWLLKLRRQDMKTIIVRLCQAGLPPLDNLFYETLSDPIIYTADDYLLHNLLRKYDANFPNQ